MDFKEAIITNCNHICKDYTKKISIKNRGYKQYFDIYEKNIFNNKIFSKYITENGIIELINSYNNYTLKEINSAIIIQKTFKKSYIYKKFIMDITFDTIKDIGYHLFDLFQKNEIDVIP